MLDAICKHNSAHCCNFVRFLKYENNDDIDRFIRYLFLNVLHSNLKQLVLEQKLPQNSVFYFVKNGTNSLCDDFRFKSRKKEHTYAGISNENF